MIDLDKIKSAVLKLQDEKTKQKLKTLVFKSGRKDSRVIAIKNIISLAKAKGTPGETGKKGIDGMRGVDGINGINGKNGFNGLPGAKGLDGLKGEIGLVGPQGDKGDAGMVWRGTYRNDIQYEIGDVVGVSGSAYVCIAKTNQSPPIGFGWELLVSRGVSGTKGQKGDNGDNGSSDASTLTGDTLANNVVNSSLTSVGTLTSLTTSSDITFTELNGTAKFGLGGGFSRTNVALGGALPSCTPDESLGEGLYNLGIGAGSLYSITTGNYNTAIGPNSLLWGQTCSQNIAIGSNTMQGSPISFITGSYNIGIGNLSCAALTTNINVIGIGRDSFYSLSSGSSNIAIGANAGKWATISAVSLTNTTSSIYIGGSSKASAATGNTNEIAIGSLALGIGSNTSVIGNTSTTANRIFGVNSTGQVAPTIASATTIAPTKQVTFISGTTAVVTITAPTGIATTGGQITLIPTDVFTTTAAGNIALASTAVVSKALIMTYDATTTKWYPSY